MTIFLPRSNHLTHYKTQMLIAVNVLSEIHVLIFDTSCGAILQQKEHKAFILQKVGCFTLIDSGENHVVKWNSLCAYHPRIICALNPCQDCFLFLYSVSCNVLNGPVHNTEFSLKLNETTVKYCSYIYNLEKVHNIIISPTNGYSTSV